MGFAADTPTKKFGKAAEVKFGCPEMESFKVIESVSATSSFQTNQMLKNEVGISVGQVVGDPKLEATITGCSDNAPFDLGAQESIALYVGDIEGQGGNAGASGGNAKDRELLIVSVKQDNSNEDFMKFEVTGEFYHNVSLGESKDLKRGDDDH